MTIEVLCEFIQNHMGVIWFTGTAIIAVSIFVFVVVSNTLYGDDFEQPFSKSVFELTGYSPYHDDIDLFTVFLVLIVAVWPIAIALSLIYLVIVVFVQIIKHITLAVVKKG